MSDPTVALTPDQQAEVYALEKMFQSDGWAILTREFSHTLGVLREGAIDHCQTPEQMWVLKGNVNALRHILGYEDSIQARKENWLLESTHEPDPV